MVSVFSVVNHRERKRSRLRSDRKSIIRHHAHVSHGPVDDPGFAYDVLSRHQAPNVRVAAVITVVAQDEVIVRGNSLKGHCIAGPVLEVWLVYQTAIHPYLAVLHLDRVSWSGYYSLDEVLLGIPRIPEDHHISRLRLAKRLEDEINRNL